MSNQSNETALPERVGLCAYLLMPLSFKFGVPAIAYLSMVRRTPNLYESVLLLSLLALMLSYKGLGAPLHTPYALSAIDGLIAAFVVFYLCAVPFFLPRESLERLTLALAFGSLAAVLLIIAYTLARNPSLLFVRRVIHVVTGAETNSPQYANWAALSSIAICALSKNGALRVAAVVTGLVIAAFLQNRTATVLVLAQVFFFMPTVGVVFGVVLAVVTTVVVAADMVVVPEFQALTAGLVTRFSAEGLETGRWALGDDGLRAVLGGYHPWGGYAPRAEVGFYFHSLPLDAYRVSGYFGFASAMLVLALGLIRAVAPKVSMQLRFVLVTCIAVLLTSVPLEDGYVAVLFFTMAIALVGVSAREAGQDGSGIPASVCDESCN